MNRAQAIVRWPAVDEPSKLNPTTLRKLGRDEEFLEQVLAEYPELLGIQSRRSGIHGPYARFRQVSLPTPAGREIFPDIVLLSASGHFIVVEVKLSDNPELKDRQVIAQIIDYAASFSALDEQQLLKLFNKHGECSESWTDFIVTQFPAENQPDELASLLLERACEGALNLVIACDFVPPGVPEVVSGIASQQTTSFDLDLVEVQPFVLSEQSEQTDIVFVPTARLSTEIVGRTTVSITYQEGTFKPDATVETSTLDEIEERTAIANASTSTARVWPPQEVEAAFRSGGNPIQVSLLEVAKEHSADGIFVSPAAKSNATFGFYVKGRREDGTRAKNMFFYYTLGFENLTIYLNSMAKFVSEEVHLELCARLKECFGQQVDLSGKEPSVPISLLDEEIDSFKNVLLWFQQQAAKRL